MPIKPSILSARQYKKDLRPLRGVPTVERPSCGAARTEAPTYWMLCAWQNAIAASSEFPTLSSHWFTAGTTFAVSSSKVFERGSKPIHIERTSAYEEKTPMRVLDPAHQRRDGSGSIPSVSSREQIQRRVGGQSCHWRGRSCSCWTRQLLGSCLEPAPAFKTS